MANEAGDVRRVVGEALAATPGIKTNELADRTGLAQADIRVTLVAMEREGAARRVGRTRGTRWYPADGDLPPEAGEPLPKKRRARANGAAGGVYGWRAILSVRGQDSDRVILAESLVAAAEIAMRGAADLGGEAVTVQLLGPALGH